jgi:hypothetical protein
MKKADCSQSQLVTRSWPPQGRTAFYWFYPVLWHLGTRPQWTQKVHTDPQVGQMYLPVSEFKNGHLTKSVGLYIWEKWSKTAQKWVFILVWGIWACPIGPKKVLEGPQVGGMYVPMSKLENRPLAKSLGPFL